MDIKLFFSKLLAWLHSSELFERPRKKIPGKWLLYEYFVDAEQELLHFTEADLKTEKHSLDIVFEKDGGFVLSSTVLIKCIANMEEGSWRVSRNFMTLVSAEDHSDSIEFQIAFEKGNLKMLKKNVAGKIEFFGFFRKLVPKS